APTHKDDYALVPFHHVTGDGSRCDELGPYDGRQWHHELVHRKFQNRLSAPKVRGSWPYGVELDVDLSSITLNAVDIFVDRRAVEGVNDSNMRGTSGCRNLPRDLVNPRLGPAGEKYLRPFCREFLGYGRTDRATSAEHNSALAHQNS